MNIKICGLTKTRDAEQALRLGAWAIGFIFYPQSPRYIEPKAVKKILTELDAKGLRPERVVGVFVNESAVGIRQAVKQSGIDIVQLHGDETPEFAKGLGNLRLWRAFRLQDEAQIAGISAFDPYVEAFLFDAAVSGSYGGTGQLADWGLLEKVPRDKPMIVSGGLNPDNARAAWDRFQPLALDLASGVELSPGIKDPAKLKKIFEGA